MSVGGPLPTFLGIGSARCGTTWLYEVLAAHPGVFVSTTKELHFWTDQVRRHGLAWYRGHFTTPAGEPPAPVRGEITPAYASLPPAVISAMARSVPELKLVLLLRNPLDRIWSHTLRAFYLDPAKPRDEQPMRRYIRRMERFMTVRLTQYERIIDDWTGVYGPDSLFVGLYDDVARDPAGLVEGVLRHVGADPAWTPPPALAERRVNPRPSVDVAMPPYCRWYLSRRWLEPMRRLDARLEGRVGHWVDELAAPPAQGEWWWPARRTADRSLIAAPEHVLGRAKYEARWWRLRRRCLEIAPEDHTP